MREKQTFQSLSILALVLIGGFGLLIVFDVDIQDVGDDIRNLGNDLGDLEVQDEIFEMHIGNEMADALLFNQTSSNYDTIISPDGNSGIIFYPVVVTEEDLVDYLGISIYDLYLDNGTSVVILQANQRYGATRFNYMYKNSIDNTWYIRIHPTEPSIFPWLIPRLLELNA